MKILILTHLYPDSSNGWRGSFIREQALSLSLEHEVAVVFFKVDYTRFSLYRTYFLKKNNSGNLNEYELIIPKWFPIINQVRYFSTTYRFIKKDILKSFFPDIIHCHLSYPAGFFGTLLQKLLGIPCVVTEHSWLKKHFRSRIHKLCAMYSLRNSAGYITVSEALKNDLLQYHQREIRVIPNVINVQKFRITNKSSEKAFNIGILGGMGNYRKGLDILIESVSLLKEREIILHIGGSGALLDKFIKQSMDAGIYAKCRFYGEISNDRLQEFYDRLDAFVLASRDETFGVVIVEAMACGLPVIATDCGGPSEIITTDTGILVEKEKAEKLAEAIIILSENLHQYDRDKIRNYALENFGYDAFNRKIIESYCSLPGIRCEEDFSGGQSN